MDNSALRRHHYCNLIMRYLHEMSALYTITKLLAISADILMIIVGIPKNF